MKYFTIFFAIGVLVIIGRNQSDKSLDSNSNQSDKSTAIVEKMPDTGIMLYYDTAENNVLLNSCSNNDIGIYLYASSNNLIKNN